MTLRIGASLPSLEGASEWVNSGIFPVSDPQALLGTPWIVHFWALSCPACKMNLPELQRLQQEYAVQGLRSLAVHTPRGPFDRDRVRVHDAVRSLGLTEPCAIDDEHQIADRFDLGGIWPRYYLFDAEGKMRLNAAGGMGLRLVERSLKRLLTLQPNQLPDREASIV